MSDWKIVPARYGRSGTKIHKAYGVEVEGRYGRREIHLTTSMPLCGSYTRPGSGWPIEGAEITCEKCLKGESE